MAAPSGDISTIRRTIRDLVAIATLPAVWPGYRPQQIVESLADVLCGTAPLHFVYVRVPRADRGRTIEVARTNGCSWSPDAAAAIGQSLNHWRNSASANVPESIPNPIGAGSVRVVLFDLGWDGTERGVLVAGSLAEDFPSEEHGLLLNVGANQAAMALQRFRAEEALRQAHERLDLGLRGSNIGIWELDFPDGDIRNGRADFTNIWEQLGYNRPAGPTDFATPMSLVHPQDRRLLERALDDYLTGVTREFDVDYRVRRSDGSYCWMLSRGVASRDATGRPHRMIGSSIDVTDHRRAEQALRVSEERFRRYFDLGLIGMAITSPTKECLEVNDEMCRILGYGRSELMSMTWATITHPDDLAADVAQFDRVMAGEIDGYSMDKRWICKDGTVIDTTISVQCLRGADGSVDYFMALLQDVTDRKRAEQAVRASEERLADELAAMKQLQDVSTRLVHEGGTAPLLLEIVDAAIAITSADMGNIQLREQDSGAFRIEASRGFDSRFLKFFDTVHASQAACGPAMQRVARVLVEDVTVSPVFVGTPALDVLLAAGVRAVQSTPLVSRSGRLVGMLSTHYRTPCRPADRDLHVLDLLARQAADWIERSNAQEELQHAKESAEAANRTKDEFLANVSHEIRTPMNAILGMTELVLGTPLSEDQRQCLESAQFAATNLLGILNDLLDFERMKAGKLELESATFSLREVVTGVLQTLTMRAHQKGLALIGGMPPEVPDALVGDVGRLRQVLLNLVGNAIKFTEHGVVLIHVHADGDDVSPDTIRLSFVVQDTGIGIPQEVHERIFRPFEQQDSSTTRKYGGTGLGLSIATRLAAMMTGTIRVESAPGRGSTFTFSAPFQRLEPAGGIVSEPPDPLCDQANCLNGDHTSHRAVAPRSVAATLRILVAEDNELNLRHLERLLGQRGHRVHVACNGREALTELGLGGTQYQQDCTPADRFDLLLLDVHMPELDGFQIVQALREWENVSGGHLPVIALTARSRKEDRRRCLQAGMDEFLSKPIQAAELFALIDTMTSVPAAAVLSDSTATNGTSLLDLNVLRAAAGDDADGLRALCRDFATFGPPRMTELRDALQAGDALRLREAAHRLCGLASAFSTTTAEGASTLEDIADRGELEQAASLVEQLEGMFRQLSDEVHDLAREGLDESHT